MSNVLNYIGLICTSCSIQYLASHDLNPAVDRNLTFLTHIHPRRDEYSEQQKPSHNLRLYSTKIKEKSLNLCGSVYSHARTRPARLLMRDNPPLSTTVPWFLFCDLAILLRKHYNNGWTNGEGVFVIVIVLLGCDEIDCCCFGFAKKLRWIGSFALTTIDNEDEDILLYR